MSSSSTAVTFVATTEELVEAGSPTPADEFENIVSIALTADDEELVDAPPPSTTDEEDEFVAEARGSSAPDDEDELVDGSHPTSGLLSLSVERGGVEAKEEELRSGLTEPIPVTGTL